MPPSKAWFLKKPEKVGKAQRRLFVLDMSSKELRYYKQETAAGPTGLKGTILLDTGVSAMVTGSELHVETPSRTFVLIASSAAEASTWAQSINDVVGGTSLAPVESPAAVSNTNAAAEPGTPTPDSNICKADFLLKRAEKSGRSHKRWFVLSHDGRLQYYVNAGKNNKGEDRKGEVDLCVGTTVSRKGSDIDIATPERVWRLVADSESTAQAWVDALLDNSAAAKPDDNASPNSPADIPISKPSPRFEDNLNAETVVSSEHAAHATANEQSPSKPGTVLLLEGQPAEESVVDDHTELRAAHATTSMETHGAVDENSLKTINTAEFPSVAPESSESFHKGWLVKEPEKRGKAQRRYFLLDESALMYFAHEGDGTGEQRKGSIDLSTVSDFSVQGLEIRLVTSARTWRLMAADHETAEEWGIALQHRVNCDTKPPGGAGYVESPTADATGETEVDSAQEEDVTHAEQHGVLAAWFEKAAEARGKARKRYFILQRDRIDYFADVDPTDPHNGQSQKGSIALIDITDVFDNGNELDIVCLSGRVYQLTNPDRDVVAKWHVAVRRAIQLSTAADTDPAAKTSNPSSLKEPTLAEPQLPLAADDEILPWSGDEAFPGVWLFKQGQGAGRFTGRKRRYFLLHFSKSMQRFLVAYYAHVAEEGPSDLRGHFTFTPESEVDCSGSDIRVATETRQFCLSGDSDESTEALFTALQAFRRDMLITPATLCSHDTSVASDAAQSPEHLPALPESGAHNDSEDTKDVVLLSGLGSSALAEEVSIGMKQASAISIEDTVAALSRKWGELETTSCLTGITAAFHEVVRQGRSGWLVKQPQHRGKARRRFFIVDATGQVKYFAAVGPDAHSGVQQLGTIDLDLANNIVLNASQLMLQTPGRDWVLTAEDRSDALQWWLAMKRAQALPRTDKDVIDDHGSAIDAPLAPGAIDASTTEPRVLLKTCAHDWLTKEAAKRGSSRRRYFMPAYTLGSRLFVIDYYSKFSDPEGCSDLKGCIRLDDVDDLEVESEIISIRAGTRTFKLTADSAATAQQLSTSWQAAHLSIADHEIDATMPILARLNQLLSEDDMNVQKLQSSLEDEYTAAERKAVQSNIDRAEGMLQLQAANGSMVWDTGASFASTGDDFSAVTLASDVALNVTAISDASSIPGSENHIDDGTALASPISEEVTARGWFLKAPAKRGKSRNRYFELVGTTVYYYEDEANGYGRGLKGTIAIWPSTTFTLSEELLKIINRERTHQLYSKSVAMLTTWRQALEAAKLVSATAAKASLDTEYAADHEDELVVGLDSGIWLKKYGQGAGSRVARRRLVVPIVGTISSSLKLNYLEAAAATGAPRFKGTILVDAETAIASDGITLSVATPTRTYRFEAGSADEAARCEQHWQQLQAHTVTEPEPKLRALAVASYHTLSSSKGDNDTSGNVGAWSPSQLNDEMERQEFDLSIAGVDELLMEIWSLYDLMHRASVCIWDGILKKRAQGLGSDHRRYFQLRGTTLFYFQSGAKGHGHRLKGSVSLSKDVQLTRPTPREISLACPGRTYELEADDLADADSFVAAMQPLVTVVLTPDDGDSLQSEQLSVVAIDNAADETSNAQVGSDAPSRRSNSIASLAEGEQSTSAQESEADGEEVDVDNLGVSDNPPMESLDLPNTDDESTMDPMSADATDKPSLATAAIEGITRESEEVSPAPEMPETSSNAPAHGHRHQSSAEPSRGQGCCVLL